MSDTLSRIATMQNNIDNKKNNQELILQNYNFSFGVEIDNITIEFLKEQTFEIHQNISKSHTKLGEVFFKSKEKLSNNKNGVFQKWYNAIGFKKDNVYRLINRYNYIVAKSEDKDIIESLPLSLSYFISSGSCSEDIQNKVLKGEIKSLKDLKIEITDNNNVENNDKTEKNFQSFYKNFKTVQQKINNINFDDLNKKKQNKINRLVEKLNEELNEF